MICEEATPFSLFYYWDDETYDGAPDAGPQAELVLEKRGDRVKVEVNGESIELNAETARALAARLLDVTA